MGGETAGQMEAEGALSGLFLTGSLVPREVLKKLSAQKDAAGASASEQLVKVMRAIQLKTAQKARPGDVPLATLKAVSTQVAAAVKKVC